MPPGKLDEGLRWVVARVAILNLAYFVVEFSVALAIGSVSLFADSIDFLEDTSVNFLILIALGWSARQRSHVGMMLAGILLIPSLATLWTAWEKLASCATPTAPAHSNWSGSYGCEPYLRAHACPLSHSRGQLDASGIFVRSQ